jgi:hypothetical protein
MSSQPDKPILRLDWCSHEAAKYAVEHWHYSRALPGADSVKCGVWENGTFIGCVLFGRGATPELCKPYKLNTVQVCELTRVALTNHKTQTSRIVAISIRMLHRLCPALRMIVSFADSSHGHHGGIYQAGGWIFTGDSFGRYIVTNGKTEHPRTLGSRYGIGGQSIPWLRKHVDPNAKQISAEAKHRYLMPLDEEMRQRILPLAKPYPKRAGSDTKDTPVHQTGKGGSIPTPALQSPK